MTRADRVAARVAERELNAVVVTNIVNVRYLSGYTGSNGICLKICGAVASVEEAGVINSV